MNDWLVKIAEQAPTDEEQLEAALSKLSSEDLQALARDAGVYTPTENLDSLQGAFADADLLGRELAHIHGDELEKQAFIQALMAGVGRLGLGNLARKLIKNKVVDTITGSVKSGINSVRQGFEAPQVPQPAGVKLARLEKTALLDGAGMMKQLAGKATKYMVSDPHRAAAVAGAGLGVAKGLISDPGVDPQTGQKRSRVGAAMKNGLVGAGVGAGLSYIPGAKTQIQSLGTKLDTSAGLSAGKAVSGTPMLSKSPVAPANRLAHGSTPPPIPSETSQALAQLKHMPEAAPAPQQSLVQRFEAHKAQQDPLAGVVNTSAAPTVPEGQQYGLMQPVEQKGRIRSWMDERAQRKALEQQSALNQRTNQAAVDAQQAAAARAARMPRVTPLRGADPASPEWADFHKLAARLRRAGLSKQAGLPSHLKKMTKLKGGVTHITQWPKDKRLVSRLEMHQAGKQFPLAPSSNRKNPDWVADYRAAHANPPEGSAIERWKNSRNALRQG